MIDAQAEIAGIKSVLKSEKQFEIAEISGKRGYGIGIFGSIPVYECNSTVDDFREF